MPVCHLPECQEHIHVRPQVEEGGSGVNRATRNLARAVTYGAVRFEALRNCAVLQKSPSRPALPGVEVLCASPVSVAVRIEGEHIAEAITEQEAAHAGIHPKRKKVPIHPV